MRSLYSKGTLGSLYTTESCVLGDGEATPLQHSCTVQHSLSVFRNQQTVCRPWATSHVQSPFPSFLSTHTFILVLYNRDLSCQPNPQALDTTRRYLPLKEPGYEQSVFSVRKIENTRSAYLFLPFHPSMETFVLFPLGSVLSLSTGIMSVITDSRQAPLSMRILPTSALSQLFNPPTCTERAGERCATYTVPK